MKSEKISNCKFMFITASLFIWAIFSVLELKSENLKELIDLSGTWRFSVGDNPKWSQPDYNTRKWDYVSLPQNWESAGYVGYDGYAWYRKDFRINNSFNKTNLYLVLGYIDDVDEVYLSIIFQRNF